MKYIAEAAQLTMAALPIVVALLALGDIVRKEVVLKLNKKIVTPTVNQGQ